MAAYARTEKNLSNASRNLHALIHRRGKTLPIPVTAVMTPIRVSRRRKVMDRPWPTLLLSSWLKIGCGPEYKGQYFFGGLTLDKLPQIEDMLAEFWKKYSAIDPQEAPKESRRCRTIPWFLHGDEGRGQCKRPLLVISYQPVLGFAGGGDHVNSKGYLVVFWFSSVSTQKSVWLDNVGHKVSDKLVVGIWNRWWFLTSLSTLLRHTFTTRILFTVVPSQHYAPDGSTLQCLMERLVVDANQLYTEGFKAKGCGYFQNLFSNFHCLTYI